MSFILGLPEYSSISHWEKGRRGPDLQTLLMYRAVFDVPVESFFEAQKEELAKIAAKRIELLLEQLRKEEPTPKDTCRIEFLEAALTRLNETTNEQQQ